MLPDILSSLLPNGAPSASHSLTQVQIERMLVESTHAHRLSEVAQAIQRLPEGSVTQEARVRAAEAAAACKAIEASIEAEQQLMLNRFARAGVEATLGPSLPAYRQTQQFTVQVSPAHLDQAVQVASDEGYWTWAPRQGSGWASYRRTFTEMSWIKPASVTTRMHLRWGPVKRTVQPIWKRAFLPNADDYRLVSLPAPLWPLYHVIHPFHRLVRRLAAHAGPKSPWPFLGTPTMLIPELLSLANVGKDDVVLDLGCGDGRVVVGAVQHSGCRAIGVERDASLVSHARALVSSAHLEDRATIIHGDAQGVSLDEVSVVFLFIPVHALKIVLPQLLQELAPGSRVVVHEQQRINLDLKPDRSKLLLSGNGISVGHVWIVPAFS